MEWGSAEGLSRSACKALELHLEQPHPATATRHSRCPPQSSASQEPISLDDHQQQYQTSLGLTRCEIEHGQCIFWCCTCYCYWYVHFWFHNNFDFVYGCTCRKSSQWLSRWSHRTRVLKPWQPLKLQPSQAVPFWTCWSRCGPGRLHSKECENRVKLKYDVSIKWPEKLGLVDAT